MMTVKAECITMEGLAEHTLTLSLLWSRCAGQGVYEAMLAPGVLLASCGEKGSVLKPSPSVSSPLLIIWTRKCHTNGFGIWGAGDPSYLTHFSIWGPNHCPTYLTSCQAGVRPVLESRAGAERGLLPA